MAVIYGTVVGADGSLVDGTTTVSTSWDRSTTQPSRGQYRLELKSNPKKIITLYVNGRSFKTVYVNGDLCLNIHL